MAISMSIADYVVALIMILIPVGIGVFYAWKDSKNTSREEYLLGGRKMNIIPVTLSIFVTYQSSISLIGFTGDAYTNGPMFGLMYVGNCVGTIVSYFTMIPVMHPLQLTSIYEYLERRYDSHALRMLGLVIGMTKTFMYMVIALLAQGLALQAAAGIPMWVSVVVIGSIGTLYTAIGGIKSVIWTDTFQTVILFGGMIILMVKGSVAVGGADKVWSVASDGGRTSFANFDPDPRTRHSWWGTVLGSSMIWMTMVFDQSNLLRVSSMSTVQTAKRSALLTIPFHLLYSGLLVALGILIYAYFYTIRCDPVESGLIDNMNQISLFFMLHVLRDTPGLSGFYMATIFSGSLSTLSSGINALAANTMEDVLGGCLRGVSEKRVVILAKIMVVIYGLTIVAVSYLAKDLDGPVTQLASALFGALGSIMVGLFMVGCIVPWANKYGAFIGAFVTLIINTWFVIGKNLYGRKHRPLPSPPTDQCASLLNEISNSTSYLYNSTTLSTTIPTLSDDSNGAYDYGFFLYDISYIWGAFIGTCVFSVTTLVTSKLTSRWCKARTDARFILPMLRKFWRMKVALITDDNGPDNLRL